MSKYDIYLQENSNVLKNKLGITDETALDTAESMMVRTRMALLYNSGFSDFSPTGVCKLHKTLFGDVYEWAGKYREINIQKRESILAGKSVWYSNWDNIDKDLNSAWDKVNAVNWKSLTHEDFAKEIAHLFPLIWQEGTGAVLLSLRFCGQLGFLRGIYYGIFHSVSAFFKAGFYQSG